MTPSQQARAARARSESLSPERRSEIARQAAMARQRGYDRETIPRATHPGQLHIGDLTLPCAVLADKTRIITEASVATTLGRGFGGKSYRLRERQAKKSGATPMPLFLAGSALEPYVPESLRIALSQPKVYRGRGGIRLGIEAGLLPEICEVWLNARDKGALQPSQEQIARNAEVLMRALAHVGITALVDEATGYQEVRDREELHRILEAYISKELLPWAKRFPDEFYEQLFKLREWQYSPVSVRRPAYVGKLTNELVYEKLPPGVLAELRSKNPVVQSGRRRYKHHQFLTEEIGDPHLERHLAVVTALMRVSSNWTAFRRLFDRAFPSSSGVQLEMPGLSQDEEEDEVVA